MSMIRTRWAAVGAAVAISLGAGGVSLSQAAISSGEKPVYISLDAPCRVIDTRSGAPIGAGDANDLTVQITGSNGACTGALAIPADAVGVSTNVTVIQPTGAPSGRSYFTVYPNGATRPVTSNLNFVNGQPPTPNKVDVGIGTGGKIVIYNNEGTAHTAVDIFGYYVDHTHDDRYFTEAEVTTKLAAKADATDVYTKTESDGRYPTGYATAMTELTITSWPDGQLRSVSVTCPVGLSPVGGGGSNASSGVAIDGTLPDPFGSSTPTGWFVWYRNVSGAAIASITIRAHVICMDIPGQVGATASAPMLSETEQSKD